MSLSFANSFVNCYEPTHVADADEALRLLRDGHIDIVLTDVEMPGSIGGIELARKINAKWPRIPVIFMSGRYLPRPDELPLSTRFLTKPFSPDRLRDVLAGIL
jgi:two-component system, response regulator PdtaR